METHSKGGYCEEGNSCNKQRMVCHELPVGGEPQNPDAACANFKGTGRLEQEYLRNHGAENGGKEINRI